jgi:hypothetical protein
MLILLLDEGGRNEFGVDQAWARRRWAYASRGKGCEPRSICVVLGLSCPIRRGRNCKKCIVSLCPLASSKK